MWAGGVVAALLVLVFGFLGPVLVPTADWQPFLQNGQKYDVRILRDTFGVPHVYGKRDADVAFGLAYAHAEDDFQTISQSVMTRRGRLVLTSNQTPRLINALAHTIGGGDLFSVEGADPAITDYLAQLLRVQPVEVRRIDHECR